MLSKYFLLNEERFSILYSDKGSRPNTPVNIIIGALTLKHLFGLTDANSKMKYSLMNSSNLLGAYPVWRENLLSPIIPLPTLEAELIAIMKKPVLI